MTSAVSTDKNEERRRRVLLGPLPAGFLRTDGTNDSLDADYQAALALQQQLCGAAVPAAGPPLTARLSITIAQAKLVKNYGLTRMDPYVRLRVGHCIYETHTDPSGGKTPRWNKVIHCLLPPGVNSIYLEIFDECSFTMDELIAWAHITIPQAVLQGETHEDWYPLNGKQGDGMEGMINLVLSYSVGPAAVAQFPPVLVVPSTGMGYATMPMYTQGPAPLGPTPVLGPAPANQHPPAPHAQVQPITQEQLQQLEEMFPSIDKEVIKTVLEANRGNKDATINSLLQMSDLLPPGVNSIYLEIFDECSFTMDELIAWAHITIPQAVLQGETHEDWYPLNGKQGDGMEGMINLVLSYSVGPAAVAQFPPVLVVPSTGMGYATMPMYTQGPAPLGPTPVLGPAPANQHPPAPHAQVQPITQEQLQQLEEMFPSIDKEVIKTVLEANRGNKDATINSLLQMSE